MWRRRPKMRRERKEHMRDDSSPLHSAEIRQVAHTHPGGTAGNSGQSGANRTPRATRSTRVSLVAGGAQATPGNPGNPGSPGTPVGLPRVAKCLGRPGCPGCPGNHNNPDNPGKPGTRRSNFGRLGLEPAENPVVAILHWRDPLCLRTCQVAGGGTGAHRGTDPAVPPRPNMVIARSGTLCSTRGGSGAAAARWRPKRLRPKKRLRRFCRPVWTAQ